MPGRPRLPLVASLLVACAAPARPPVSGRDAAAFDRPTTDATPPPDAGREAAPAPDAAPLPDLPLPPDAPPPPSATAGLRLTGEGDLTGLAHARELALLGDLVFLADSNGLPILRTRPGGALEVVRPLTRSRDFHCSTLSAHPRSRTMICAAADTGTVDFIDVADPTRPVSHPWVANEHDARGNPPIYSLPDIEVSGDTLWMAANRNGLLRVDLGADGRPTALTRTRRGREVTNVIARGGRLFLTDRVQGLEVLAESDLSPVASQALAGPPIDLDVQGDRVAVALGSEGARVFRLADGALTEVASLQPRCVAAGVALDGDRLAVACLTGVTLYDLAASPPRVAGFFPARFGMLDVAFGPHGLLASDWFRVDQFAVATDGAVVLPEAPFALRLPPGAAARVAVRNPGPEAFTAAWTLANTRGGPSHSAGTIELPAHGDAVVSLPAASLEAAGSRENAADLLVYRPGATAAELAAAPRTRLWHRGPADDPARGVVAIGDRFPTLRRISASPAPATLPPTGTESLVMFLTVDCYLQWPQLEDMAWDAAHGQRQPRPVVLYLTLMDKDPFDPRGYLSNYGAVDVPTYEWADYARSMLGQEGVANPVEAFERSLSIATPGADFPHDYRVGADGTTLDTLRIFRGRWHLRAP
jgi:hypothetical protein